MGKTSAPPLDGEAIRKARLAKFMTQVEVAEQVASRVARHAINFDHSSVSRIEVGDVKRPNLKVVQALAKVLGLEVDDIFLPEDGEADEDDDAKAAA